MIARRKHSGLALIGIYLSFFFNFVLLIYTTAGTIYLVFDALVYGIEYFYYDYFLLFSTLTVFGIINIVLLRHLEYFKNMNYVLIGLITLIPSLIIGGLFILIDGNRSIQSALFNSSNIQNNSPLEIKLKEIDNLFERRIITKEEYDLKRKDIISRY